MPLRDHYRPPVSQQSSWEGFHAGWPMVIVQHLHTLLPPGYVAEPRIRLGTVMEIDIGALESEGGSQLAASSGNHNGEVAALAWTATQPVLAVETEPRQESGYEVLIFDVERNRRLVAAIELVSPANKDRQESRNAFVGKCAALLRSQVAVSIVDLVTVRRFNLYAQVMAFIGHPDPTMTPEEPPTYAASCRWLAQETRGLLEAWSHPMVVGQPLPLLPLWLSENRVVPLKLEDSYEQACKDLWIP